MQKISRRGRKTTDDPTSGNPGPQTGQGENDYEQVNVLVLTFDYSDLNLKSEATEIVNLFQSLDYNVDEYTIPMDNSLENLRQELNTFLAPTNPKTLLIIYYHGHGGIEADRTLSLAR